MFYFSFLFKVSSPFGPKKPPLFIGEALKPRFLYSKLVLREDNEGSGIEDWAVVSGSDFDGILVASKVDGWGNDELSHFGGEWGSVIANINGGAIELAGEVSLGHGLAIAGAGALGGHDHLVVASFGSLDFVSEDSGVLVTWGNLAIASEGGVGMGTGTLGPIGNGDLDTDFVGGSVSKWDVVLAIGVGGWGSFSPGAGNDFGVVWANGFGGAGRFGAALGSAGAGSLGGCRGAGGWAACAGLDWGLSTTGGKT